jgi:hypothetical protein
MSRLLKLHIVFLCLLFVSLFGCSPKLKKTVSEGLIIYYPFDSGVKDASGNDNHGIASGTKPAIDRFNKANGAYEFNGQGDYIIFPNAEPLRHLPLTVSFWANFSTLNPAILGTCVSSSQAGIWFSIGTKNETKGKLAVNIGDGGFPSSSSRKTLIADEMLETEEWYHILAIVIAPDNIELYLNGRKLKTKVGGNAEVFYSDGNPGYIGRVWQENSFFQGKFDEFRVYDRVLTQSEIGYLAH